MRFQRYRRRVGSNLTPAQRGFAWGFGLAAVFWAGVIGLVWYFW